MASQDAHAAKVRPLIIIDPGHGGEQSGATGICGMKEKDVTLAIALALRDTLHKSGHANATLTRENDATVALSERAQIANALRADVFLSIHANASTSADIHGVETFFLSLHSANLRVEHLALRENEQLTYERAAPSDPVESIIAGLRLDASHHESQRLAMRIQTALSKRLGGSRGVLQAPFWVLHEAQMASALVEVGFLTHPAECTRLMQTRHQQEIATTLAAALLTHLSAENERASKESLGIRPP